MIPSAALFDPLPILSAGARLRAARFDADPQVAKRGTCVLLNGQTEFIEKYFEVIDELRGRGFAVATMDWRGQGGSARLLHDDSRKGFVGDFRDYDADLESLMNAVVRPMLGPGERPIALAHSMGGHILLRRLVRRSGEFDACACSAPMIAISLRGQWEFLVRLVTAFEVWRGNRAEWVWGMEARDPHRATFDTQLATGDPQRFARTQALLRQHPDLRLAGATWGWLSAALKSMDWLRAPKRPEQIATPLLVVGAQKDRICLTAQTRAFAARVPGAIYLEIADAEHELLMERDVIRRQFWAAFDDFISKNTAPQQS